MRQAMLSLVIVVVASVSGWAQAAIGYGMAAGSSAGAAAALGSHVSSSLNSATGRIGSTVSSAGGTPSSQHRRTTQAGAKSRIASSKVASSGEGTVPAKPGDSGSKRASKPEACPQSGSEGQRYPSCVTISF
jgi:hypothetical protein